MTRDCVDGVLCRTPEELFDLLLEDCLGYEEIRRTKGRGELDEKEQADWTRYAGRIWRSAGRKQHEHILVFDSPDIEGSVRPCGAGPYAVHWICAGIVFLSSMVLGLVSAVLCLLAVALLLLCGSVEGFVIYLFWPSLPALRPADGSVLVAGQGAGRAVHDSGCRVWIKAFKAITLLSC